MKEHTKTPACAAPLANWVRALGQGELHGVLAHYYGANGVGDWQARYLEILAAFADLYGPEGEVVIARCPGQMNLMGVHIDYGGMPSLRLAVRGADTITVARASTGGRVRLRSEVAASEGAPDRFAPVEFELADILPSESVRTRQALMEYAGRVCSQREARGGPSVVDDWGILPQGQLIFLESYFRERQPLRGFDAVVWSNVSPSGGMSSSSALVISTAWAALGVNGLWPGVDMPEEDLVDGIGTSEWIRGTRGGTADHGGMIMGRSGSLVSVGVFPARAHGYAVLPEDYAALILDSGVSRVYDEAVKEETVIAYPLGTFMVRDLLLPRLQGKPGFEGLVPDFRERITFIRDVTAANLGLGPPAIYQLLSAVPRETTLGELKQAALAAGAVSAYEKMHEQEIGDRFQRIGTDYPIRLRRRFAYGLAEQDRVEKMLDYLNQERLDTALDLVRISHQGDRDQEVGDAELADLGERSRRGEERAQLCFLPGGYGRMTPAYDRVVCTINEHLLSAGGPLAGAVQRLGAGWGGNVGGLVTREYLAGPGRAALERKLAVDLGLEADLTAGVAVPGEGACLLPAPGV